MGFIHLLNRLPWKSAIQFLVAWGCLIFLACSSSPRKNEHLLRQILLYNLHLRRPEFVGARFNASIGDEDYESHPKPGKSLDCISIQSLFKEIDLKRLRECLKSSSKLQTPWEISYELIRETAPYLKLEEPQSAPECIQQSLGKIPVPREIFFQSNEQGHLNCYSSRISIFEDEWLGLYSFFHTSRVKLTFPPAKLPITDEETLLLLGIWSTMPFWREKDNAILGTVVPTELCQKCMGDKNMFLEADQLPPHWP
jgi:hypothetical protein